MAARKKENPVCYPSALTIAGSDSGGGAGIQADLRTFNAYGVFGCSAITAVTAQNPTGVRRIDPIPAEGVRAQIDAVAEKIAVRHVKTGMLFSPENIAAAAEAVRKYRFHLVCDPVMVATSGAKLLQDDAIGAVRQLLLPCADWITPNIPEAELLTGHAIRGEKALLEAAEELADLFHCSVLLKGGHADPDKSGKSLPKAVDAVRHDGKSYRLSSLWLDLPKMTAHGTGCTLSSALTAAFALEWPWQDALTAAKAFVLGSLMEYVMPGENLPAMYPPQEEYLSRITLTEVK